MPLLRLPKPSSPVPGPQGLKLCPGAPHMPEAMWTKAPHSFHSWLTAWGTHSFSFLRTLQECLCHEKEKQGDTDRQGESGPQMGGHLPGDMGDRNFRPQLYSVFQIVPASVQFSFADVTHLRAGGWVSPCLAAALSSREGASSCGEHRVRVRTPGTEARKNGDPSQACKHMCVRSRKHV